LKARFNDRRNKSMTTGRDSVTVSPIVRDTPKQYLELPDYARFAEQRASGKVLQLLGVAAIGVASYMTLDNAARIKDGKDPNKVPTWLPLAGLGVMGIGIVIDLNANRWLHVKTP